MHTGKLFGDMNMGNFLLGNEYGKHVFSSCVVSQAVPIEILVKNDRLNLKSACLANNIIFLMTK